MEQADTQSGTHDLLTVGRRIGYCGLSCALILASETFLLARSVDSLSTLLLLVGSQIALCLVLWLLTRSSRLFERVSPMWVCVLFLLGVIWAVILPASTGLRISSVVVVLPAALLFGMGNSLNAYFLLDFCRLSTPTEFCRVAMGGAACGAAINFVISYLMPDYACALCGVVAFAWLALRQVVSKSTAARRPLISTFEADGSNVTSLYLSAASLCLACGFMPAAVFNTSDFSDNPLQHGLTAAAIALLAALLVALALSWRKPRSMTLLAACATISAATGYLALPFLDSAALACASAVTLVAQLVVVCVVCYLFAQYVGDPGIHPARFWVAQIAVLALTSTCTFASIDACHRTSSPEQTALALSLICVWCLLLVYTFFRHIWAEPALPGEAATPTNPHGQILGTGAGDAVGNSVAQRCSELAQAYGLTERESEVLHLVASGWTIDMIARRLVVAPDTVRTHLKHLYPKLGVHSRSELLGMVGIGEDALASVRSFD